MGCIVLVLGVGRSHPVSSAHTPCRVCFRPRVFNKFSLTSGKETRETSEMCARKKYVGFFTAAVWCVPALRVPLVHSLINHFRKKIYIFCMRLRLTRTYTKRENDHRGDRAAAWLESTTYVRPTPRHLPRRPRPPIHGRAFCAPPGISNLYSMAFAGRAVMACARWRPLAAGLRQSGVPTTTVQGQS